MDGIESILAQNSAAIVTVGAFLWYLVRKDAMYSKTIDSFNCTLQNHLQHNVDVEKQLASSLQALTDCIKGMNVKKK